MIGRWICVALTSAVILGVAPASDATLFALVDTGELYASDDLGRSWTIRSTLPVSDAEALVAGSSSLQLYLASRSGTLYRSTDAGVTWGAAGTVTASDVVDLSGRPDGALVLMTRSGTIWESADGGGSFTAIGTIPASNMVSLTVGSNTNLYALTRTGEVLESLDGGTVWTPVGTIPVSAAVEIRRRDVNLYVLTATGVTYESTNDGATWAAVGTVSQVGIAGLCTTANRLVAVTKEGLVARTTDGAAWTWVGTVNQLQVLALANDYPTLTGVLETPPVLGHLVMAPPYPNPLATGRSLAIRFELPDPDVVRLDLFDASGRRIADRSPKSFSSSGVHVVNWRPNVAPGVYFLRLSTDRGLTANRRVIVLP